MHGGVEQREEKGKSGVCKIHLKSNCQMEKPDSQRSQAGTAGQAGTECTVLKAVETKFQEKHC